MTTQPDYTQMAQGMLQMWQDHWKNFSAVMQQTAPQREQQAAAASQAETKREEKVAGTTGGPLPEGMEQWQRFMASWAQTNSTTAAPAAAQEQNERQPEPTTSTRPAAPAAAAGAAPDQRDVLFIELTRRVEFLHERVIKLESELEKFKRRV